MFSEGEDSIASSLSDSKHRIHYVPADIDGYADSGLPTKTMGRSLDEDPLFFSAPLERSVRELGAAMAGAA